MTAVVDTNVPVVANGKSAQASPDCVLKCVESIGTVTKGGRLVLDDGWLIIAEYTKHLAPSGQPGPGDAFLKWVLTNWTNPERCDLVPISPRKGTKTDFSEFPQDPKLRKFDPSDRKFVAVARAHPECPPILQAVDLKWWDYRRALKSHGVTVQFLCPKHVQRS